MYTENEIFGWTIVGFVIGIFVTILVVVLGNMGNASIDLTLSTTITTDAEGMEIATQTVTTELVDIQTYRVFHNHPVHFNVDINGVKGQRELWVDGKFLLLISKDTIANNYQIIGKELFICEANPNTSELSNQVVIRDSLDHVCPPHTASQ